MINQRVAIVTGAAGSFGAAIAERLHRDGFFVVVSDANLVQATHVSNALVNSMPILLDVTELDAVISALKDVIEQVGRIDVVVNNAGIGLAGNTVTTDLRDFDRTMDINLRGAYLVTRAAIEYLRGSGSPRVIMLGSRTWLSGGNPAYTASKAGIVGLARAVANDIATMNGTCNVVAPGPVDTPFVDNMKMASQRDENFNRYQTMTPLARNAKPEDVAGAVAFFAGEDSSFITGEVLHVAGGLQLAPKL